MDSGRNDLHWNYLTLDTLVKEYGRGGRTRYQVFLDIKGGAYPDNYYYYSINMIRWTKMKTLLDL